MSKRLELTGNRYGMWTVLSFAGRNSNDQTIWLCRCDCGTERSVVAQSLRDGSSESCGCVKGDKISKIKTTHGQSRKTKRTSQEVMPTLSTSTGWGEGKRKRERLAPQSLTYQRWLSMKNRCEPWSKDFRYYAKKGIKVCERWENSFENFLLDMGECPSTWTLDRLDSNKDYQPGNCRWATKRDNSLAALEVRRKGSAAYEKWKEEKEVCPTCGCDRICKSAA